MTGVKKSKKKENVQIRLSEERLLDWKAFVESNPELSSVSKLIRSATNQYILFARGNSEYQGNHTIQKIFADNWKNFYRVRILEANLKEYLQELDVDKPSVALNLQDLQYFLNMNNLIIQKIFEKINKGEKLKEMGIKNKDVKAKA
jgi:hypothetical protein